MKIALFQPQIPQNTGNIARTCAATGTGLILVRPFGFSVSNRQLKRAGLDYWQNVSIEEIDDLPLYLEGKPCFFFSSRVKRLYTEAHYSSDAILIFGSETAGLPQEFWQRWPDQFYTIPMAKKARCLNLACSAAIVLYEALRQTHFEGLKNKDKSKESTTLTMSDVATGM